MGENHSSFKFEGLFNLNDQKNYIYITDLHNLDQWFPDWEFRPPNGRDVLLTSLYFFS